MDSSLEDRLRASYRAQLRQEAARMFGGQSDYARKKWVNEQADECIPAALSGASILLRSSVSRVTLVLYGSQPVPRVQLKCGARRYTVDPYALLRSGIEAAGRIKNAVRAVEAWQEDLEIPLALLSADVTNAVSKALVDEEIVRPIKEKLAKQRELARLNALAQVKETFKNVSELVSKEDIIQVWDEVLVAKVMDS